jgi:hypothetical protein
MISVSDRYNPFPPVRHVGLGVTFGVFSISAKPSADVYASETGALDRLRQTINDNRAATGKYATLEPGLWRLDGSYSILPDDLASVETGWWSSSLSGSDGVFALQGASVRAAFGGITSTDDTVTLTVPGGTLSGDVVLSAPSDTMQLSDRSGAMVVTVTGSGGGSGGSAPWVQYSFPSPISTIGWDLFFDGKSGQYPTAVLVTVYYANGNAAEHTFSTSGTVQYLELAAEDYTGVRFTFLSTSEPLRRVRLLEVVFGHSEAFDANSVGGCVLRYALDPISEAFPSAEIEFTFDNSDKKYNLLSPEGLYEYLQEGQHIDASVSIDGEPVHMGSYYFRTAEVSDNIIMPTIRGSDIVLSLDEEAFAGGSGAEMALSDAVALVLAGLDIPVQFGGDAGSRTVIPALQSVSRREALRLLAQAAMCAVWCDRRGVIRMESLSLGDPLQELTSNELYDFSGVSIADPVDMAEVVVRNPFIDGDGIVYTAGSGKNVRSINNPCVAPSMGDAVAAWVLAWSNRRKVYAVKNRCDPAVELGDTIRIHDIYGGRGTAVVTSIEVEYTGGLSAVTGGVGQ